MGPRTSELTLLTSLRFFAALHVVLLHAYDQFSHSSILQLPPFVLEFVKSGAVAVSVFFILSGFILSYNYSEDKLRGNAAIKEFWVARLARIYPVYLVGLLLALPKFISESTGAEGWFDKLVVGISALTLTQAWIPNFALAWNPPGWSLSAEAFFYLLFPGALLLIKRLTTAPMLIGAMVVCWLASLLPPMVASSLEFSTHGWASFLKFNPLLRLPEFILGIVLGRFFTLRAQRFARSANHGLRAAVTCGLIVVILCQRPRLPKLLLHNGLLDPLFAVLILALAGLSVQSNFASRLLSGKTLLLLGQASYALYILHIPCKGLLLGALKKVAPISLTNPFHSSLLFLVYLGGCVGVSLMTFKYLEVPARRWIKQCWIKAQGSPSASAGNLAEIPNPPVLGPAFPGN